MAPLAQYQNFLLLIGSVFAPLFGVVLVDHFILRKRSVQVASAALRWPALLAWLGGVSTYTGETLINNGSVKLDLGNNRLPTGTVVSLGQAANSNLGTLDLNGRSQEIAGLVSTSGINATASKNTVTSATAATLTINVANGVTHTYGAGTAANSGVLAGALSLIKIGGGTQVLGDANTFTGGTTISAGTLQVGAGGTTGTLAGAITNNAALVFNLNDDPFPDDDIPF